ncbi:unnamed protein product [Acanthoscelides obtectus]|uniref:Mos1 transposase HTH domain-containing protein n=1 Tax=Acanthoscelides obtectus TaxID=200917 RepID=A0A9P0PJI3_ACAOB|nr:unnamed protein product [Acanthoscelides obtectus]CAK1647470.1 Histone-lysine N-methyltransferase SETMAR [Acanthoscelides obtectus]
MELNREHFRAIIYYNFQRQLSQQECLVELLSVFGNEAPHQSTISRWYGEFKRVTLENVDVVRKLIIEDRYASLKISKTSIKKNLHEELGVRKLVSRWIPHLLTEEQKADRVNCIVRGDESWTYYYKPENKRQSAVWVFQGEEKPTKVIRSRTGHIATIPLNEQRTLRKINPERRIILHQDNASSHTAQKNKAVFNGRKLKNRLRGQRFQSPEEAVDAFKNANKCFENWFERMQMCINLRGEYFEKQ